MEESLEKLKILDYEEEFCQTNNNDLLTRTQFAMPSANPAENFKTFAALVQWLMALNGNYTEQWDRFTDPNVTVANMSACPPPAPPCVTQQPAPLVPVLVPSTRVPVLTRRTCPCRPPWQ